MSNFTRFNHKPLINPAYQESIQYEPSDLKDLPFKKAADLYKFNPEMTYSILAMYRSTSDYGDQIVAIVKPENPVRADNMENVTVNSINLHADGAFRMALPRKYTEIINVDDAGLIDDCNKGLARFRITQYHSKKFNKELNDIQFL